MMSPLERYTLALRNYQALRDWYVATRKHFPIHSGTVKELHRFRDELWDAQRELAIHFMNAVQTEYVIVELAYDRTLEP